MTSASSDRHLSFNSRRAYNAGAISAASAYSRVYPIDSLRCMSFNAGEVHRPRDARVWPMLFLLARRYGGC